MEENMETVFNKILMGIAFSPNLKQNILETARLSCMLNAQFIGVHVGEETDEKKNVLHRILEEIPDLKSFKIIFQKGNPVEVILNICKTQQIDLLILGALQKENVFKYYLGSIARKLTRKAPCSVLLIIKHSLVGTACKHIVINGLKDPKTEYTIRKALYVAKGLSCKKVTIVEEIEPDTIEIKVEDDYSLKKAAIARKKIAKKEEQRIQTILENVPKNLLENLQIKTQSIFGKTGYSIGHYARVVHSDLLVMNAPKKNSFWSRIFMRDIEYILSDIPTDLLIIKK